MHYYQHNIADYRKDTSHLSLLEHGIYRQLLDTYYLDEKPIETQSVMRRLSIKTQDEKDALNNVLSDFFELSDCGNFYHHSRCEGEIIKYKAKVDTAKANGSKGGRPPKPKKTKRVNSANPEKTQTKANQEPLTNNHKPIDKRLDQSVPDHTHDDLFERFWAAGMLKTGKKKAKPIFLRLLSNLKNEADDEFTQRLIDDIKARLDSDQLGFAEMHPATYLNGERWNDQLVRRRPEPMNKPDAFERLTDTGWADGMVSEQ